MVKQQKVNRLQSHTEMNQPMKKKNQGNKVVNITAYLHNNNVIQFTFKEKKVKITLYSPSQEP